jgi:glycosyltransferase involved in cell wall biosynthesis
MEHYPIFISVVFSLKNQGKNITEILHNAVSKLSAWVSDYELIVIDNASTDNSVEILKSLTSLDGFPNLQVYALTKEVDTDTAAWIGLENALGDFVAVINPLSDDFSILPSMLDAAISGSDVVFANNEIKSKQSIGYRLTSNFFNKLYKLFNNIDLSKEAPQYRVLSKRIINFILQHSHPAISYRHLPATAGFIKSYINYSFVPANQQKKYIGENIERGIRLLISTTNAPMRLVNLLSLFGAGANLIYSLYVVLIGIFADNVAPGWVSMSLQVSGMFFLISLVLLVLGEYILHMSNLTNEGPLYHVGHEFTSAKIMRLEKLNIEVITPATKPTMEN